MQPKLILELKLLNNQSLFISILEYAHPPNYGAQDGYGARMVSYRANCHCLLNQRSALSVQMLITQ